MSRCDICPCNRIGIGTALRMQVLRVQLPPRTPFAPIAQRRVQRSSKPWISVRFAVGVPCFCSTTVVRLPCKQLMRVRIPTEAPHTRLAQRGERLPYKQEAVGSRPSPGTNMGRYSVEGSGPVCKTGDTGLGEFDPLSAHQMLPSPSAGVSFQPYI